MEERWIKIIYWIIFSAGILTTVLAALQNSLRERLERYKLLEQGNPLFPLMISGSIDIDFSNASPDHLKIVDDFKNYLFQYIDSTGNYYQHLGKELPKTGFVLNKERATYYNFKMSTPPVGEEYSSAAFYMCHNNFIKTILPDIYLAFIEKDNFKKEFINLNADLFMQITNYDVSSDSDITLTYRIDFVNQKVKLEFNLSKPRIERTNGIIKSVYSCRKGWIGLGLQDKGNDGITCKPDRVALKYGNDYKGETQITFQEGKSLPGEVFKDSFWHRNYFMKKGKDILKQHSM